MWDEDEKVEGPHKGSAFVAHASLQNEEVIIEVAGQKQSGGTEGFGHIFPVTGDVPSLNGLSADDEKSNRDQV